MVIERKSATFGQAIKDRKTAADEAKRRKEARKVEAKGLHVNISTIIKPHLPRLPKERTKTDKQLERYLDRGGFDRDMDRMREITDKDHIIGATYSEEDQDVKVEFWIDGRRLGIFGDEYSGTIDIRVKGLPERYLLSQEAIVVESNEREIPAGEEVVFGARYDQTRPVYSRSANAEDIERLESLVQSISQKGIEFTRRSVDKVFC